MRTLAVDPSAPWILKAAAEAILVMHVGGGAAGMVSGATALIARKGGRAHAIAGQVFFVSMLAMAGIGAAVSPFLDALLPAAPNIIAGIMTLYLIVTSWATIRRRDGHYGALEIGGLAVALAVCAAGVFFIHLTLADRSAALNDTPPQTFYVFLLVGGIAAASDLKLILRGGIAGVPRLARHLWRMCVALTIAAGSFFLGQQQVLPKALQGSSLLYLPVFAPLILMAFWLIRVRIKTGRPNQVTAPRPASRPADFSPG